MNPISFRAWRIVLGLSMALGLSACEPLSLTMLTIGAGMGVSHQMSGPASRTFTAPMPRVKAAAVLALRRMEIKVASVEKTGNGEILRAQARNRNIEIEIESLSPSTTRVWAVARKDLLMVDAATAAEIIQQTQKAMLANGKQA